MSRVSSLTPELLPIFTATRPSANTSTTRPGSRLSAPLFSSLMAKPRPTYVSNRSTLIVNQPRGGERRLFRSPQNRRFQTLLRGESRKGEVTQSIDHTYYLAMAGKIAERKCSKVVFPRTLRGRVFPNTIMRIYSAYRHRQGGRIIITP